MWIKIYTATPPYREAEVETDELGYTQSQWEELSSEQKDREMQLYWMQQDLSNLE